MKVLKNQTIYQCSFCGRKKVKPEYDEERAVIAAHNWAAHLLETMRDPLIEAWEVGHKQGFEEGYQAGYAKEHLHIGDLVVDEDGGKGVVGIRYDDGDFVFWPGGNDAAHPTPRKEEHADTKEI